MLPVRVSYRFLCRIWRAKMKSSHFISHLPTGSPRWCQSASSWACFCESSFSFSDQGSQFLQDAHTIKVRPDARTDADLVCAPAPACRFQLVLVLPNFTSFPAACPMDSKFQPQTECSLTDTTWHFLWIVYNQIP